MPKKRAFKPKPEVNDLFIIMKHFELRPAIYIANFVLTLKKP